MRWLYRAYCTSVLSVDFLSMRPPFLHSWPLGQRMVYITTVFGMVPKTKTAAAVTGLVL